VYNLVQKIRTREVVHVLLSIGNVAADNDAIVADSELDDGWTRVEPAGFPGGVLMARQQRMLGDPSVRQRGFVVDGAESVLGNILRASDIRAEALEELEDTLGIRISHRGDTECFARGSSGRFGLIGVSSSSGSIDVEAPIGSSSNNGVTLFEAYFQVLVQVKYAVPFLENASRGAARNFEVEMERRWFATRFRYWRFSITFEQAFFYSFNWWRFVQTILPK
jgi:hypothetical protein